MDEAVDFRIDFIPRGSIKAWSFFSIRDLRKWVKEELNQWNFDSVPQPFKSFEDNFKQVKILLREVESLVHSEDDRDYSKFCADAQSILNMINSSYFIYTKSEIGKLLFSCKDRNSRIAAIIYINGENPNINNVVVNQAEFLRVVIGYAINDKSPLNEATNSLLRLESYSESWHKALAEFNSKASEKLDDYDEEVSALQLQSKELKSAIQSLEQDYKSIVEALEKSWSYTESKLIEENKRSLDSIELAYKEKIALLAPVEHWSKKKAEHAKLSRIWLIVFVSSIFLALISVSIFYREFLFTLIIEKGNSGIGSTLIVFLAFPAFLIATWIRVAHRSYRDHVRFAQDAAQRATLTQAYLALVGDANSKVTENERLLALHALFRGTATAESADDTPQINALEAIIQVLKPKTGTH